MKKNDTLCNQVYEHVKQNIIKGAYKGGRLPTETALAEQLFVSRITIKNAMARLADEGLIIRIQGKGSFVKAMEVPGTAIVENEKTKDAKTIALVMGGYTSSFGLDVLMGAMDEAHRQGAHLIAACTHNDQRRETEIVSSLINSGVAGLIVQPVHGESYSKQLISAVYSGYPLVMLDRYMQGIEAPFVGVNNRELSCFAVNKLIDSGHTDIALLALADERSSTIRERIEGYMDACAQQRVPVNRDLWLINLNGAFDQPPEMLIAADTYESYVSQIEKHLTKHPQITAIFGIEYRVSRAAMDALGRIGRRVPRDVSIVSFDTDSNIGSPAMSYIRQPQTEMGLSAVKMLIGKIEGRPCDDIVHLLKGEWIDGGTVQMKDMV